MIAGTTFASSSVAADSGDRIAALQDKFRCPIFEYLMAIHKTPIKSKDRYLTAAITDPVDEKYYAQCIFYNKDRKMHCEASSPFYHEQLKTFFTRDRLGELRQLGYTTKPSKNNFHLERASANIDQLYDIAGLYVDTLARVFDMQLDETLTYHAPLVPTKPSGDPADTKYCRPMVSLR